MSFLRKHYEKAILMILLVVFIFSLLFLISKSGDSPSIKFPTPKPDYQSEDFSAPKYTVVASLSQGIWTKSTARTPETESYSDLMIPMPISRCPYCNQLISSIYFKGGKNCPACGKRLKKKEISKFDEDEDKIPDKIELANGLDPKNPDDAHWDQDNDGFTNLQEYNYDPSGKSINNPKLHPSKVLHLRLVKISRTKLPLMVKRVIKKGEDKSRWEIQVEVRGRKKWRTRFPKLNETLTLAGHRYKIVDIIHRTEEEYKKGIKDTVLVDKSRLILQRLDSSDKITAKVGKEVYDPKRKIQLKDVVSGRHYSKLLHGSEFTVEDTQEGKELMFISSVLAEFNAIVVTPRQGSKSYYITKNRVQETENNPSD